jgi:TolA-binding protein
MQAWSNALAGVCLVLAGLLPLQSQDLPLNEAYAQARGLFLNGSYADAADAFAQFRRDFAGEDALTMPAFEKTLLAMHGMSALLSGDAATALEHLGAYSQRHYQRQPDEAVIVLGMLQAQKTVGGDPEILTLQERFLSDFPNHADRYLIQFERLLLLFRSSDPARAGAAAEAIWKSGAPSDLKFRARLITIQEWIQRGDWSSAAQLLRTTRWEVATMPELAVLAFSALRIADWHLTQEAWQEAIEAYRLVPFYTVLVDLQRERLAQLEVGMRQVRQREGGSRGAAWESHYGALARQVREQLEQLEQGEDYTPAFLLKYGRALLFLNRHAEAWVTFRSLALTPGARPSDREQAWYHWILASHGAGNWDESRDLCLEFAAHFPESPLLPQALFLLARTHQDSGDLFRANQVLRELLERFPQDPAVAEWHLTLGFNLASLNENEEALKSLEAAMFHPGGNPSVSVRAKYWHAVTLSSMSRFQEAVDALRSLQREHPGHWLFPEFGYRLGMAYYSMRDYERADEALKEYLATFSDHPYAPEARVLLGDVEMGKGKLQEAMQLFRQVDTSQPRLFMYAWFQIGKILQALEDYPAMEAHYREYLNALPFPGKARVSEALYWVGWAMARQDREDETVPLYLNAFSQWGNQPDAGELLPMLQALETLKRRMAASTYSSVPADDPEWTAFRESPSFVAWVADQSETAREQGRSTWFARLRLFESQKLRLARQPERARQALIALAGQVPVDAMDDQILGEVGLALVESDIATGMDLLRRLLLRYPLSPHKALAYYGFALNASQQRDAESANLWIQRFERETPSHPVGIEVRLLHGAVLGKMRRWDDAAASYQELLRWKHARGEPHVRALRGLAQLHTLKGEPRMAIPYWQRIYAMYRGWLPYVTEAYVESARLFEQLGDLQAAYNTWEELLRQEDLRAFAGYDEATAESERLRPLLASAAAQNGNPNPELP